MPLAIQAMGTALPDSVINRDTALALARTLADGTEEQETWLSAIYANSGISTRRFCLSPQVVSDVVHGTNQSNSPYLPRKVPGERGPSTGIRMEHYAEFAPPLAAHAARRALEQSGCSPRDITHIVTVSCTGFLAPGVDYALIEELGLGRGVERTHVGYMGCHGALNGLRVARAVVGSDPSARVLLVAVELCCLHYFYGWDPQKIIANSLFADGAAALVATPTIAGDRSRWRNSASGSYVFPDSGSAMTWTVGDYGFEMTLSKQVPLLIAEQLRPWLERWLAGRGLSIGDVPSWAVHPGGPKILDGVQDALDLSAEQMADSRAVLDECGNMSSPTILFIIDRLRHRDAPRPCVALGFGPGLVVEAALFE